MNPRLTGFYIHLPDSLPESAAEVLDTSLKNLNELSDKLNASAQDLGIRIVNPRILVRKHSILSSLKEKDSLEILDLSNEPYEALKTILAKPDLPVEDLDARMETYAFFHGLFPLLDLELSVDLLHRHVEFLSSYTYAENVPLGLSPDYISAELFELEKKPESDIRSFVFKNFHELDAEVAFYQPDLRIHRLEFNGLSHRSISLCKSVAEGLSRNSLPRDLKGLDQLIRKEPDIIRLSPSYLEIELCSQSPVRDKLILPPGSGTLGEKDRARVLKDLDSMLPNDVTVCLGGLGDSGSDAGAPDFALKLLGHPSVKQVIVETYGYDFSTWIQYLQSNSKEAMEARTESGLSFIVRFCSLRSDRYEYFYENGSLSKVLSQLDILEDYLKQNRGPGFSVYLEMQKIQEVEDEIHEFFQKYDPTVFTPILRKLNTYAGVLEDRKVADLTPPIRGFCWHLARDIYINSDGKIPICRQDPLGGGTELNIQQAFQNHKEAYIYSMQGQHDQISAPCMKCDEWYLFQG
ncbi:MAG: spiro-SPASM protein [Leptospiraceae bacterium]